MAFLQFCAYVSLVLSCVIVTSEGHGRLKVPPGRASMWRYGFDTPHNYNDNQLFCGGFSVQWNSNGGNCGVCGDNYADPQPRDHEGGGFMATGTIARTYTQGQSIDVTAEITAAHLGWFEFRLCPHNSPNTPVTQECLDQYLLEFEDGTTRTSDIVDRAGDFNYVLKLPAGVTCSQCVLQWKYNTGNSWGTDPVTGESAIGLGPQEQFYGCADIAITANGDATDPPAETDSPTTTTTTTTTVPPSTSTSTSTTTVSTATEPTTSSTTTTTTSTTTTTTSDDAPTTGCRPTPAYEGLAGMDYWCVSNCAMNYCPSTHCVCDGGIGAYAADATPCVSAGLYEGYPGMDQWCDVNCAAGYCPESHCECSGEESSEEEGEVCRGANAYEGDADMDTWCVTNCAMGNCPVSHCICETTESRRKRDLKRNSIRNFLGKRRAQRGAIKP